MKIGEKEYQLPLKIKEESGFFWIVDDDDRDIFENEEAAARFIVSALNAREEWKKVEDGLPLSGRRRKLWKK